MDFHLDKNKARRSFERAADSYDGAAVVPQRMADELVDRLDVLKLSPGRILDAGCGTGYALPGLMQRFPGAEFILLDFASPMLRRVRLPGSDGVVRICADLENMPLSAHSVDMVFCNAVLEWCEFGAVLTEFLRVLKPEGLLTFATLGPDTLVELRAAWRQVDDGVHTHSFTDMHNLGDALTARQFTAPVMDVDYVTVTHRDLNSALRDLQAQGAANVACARSRGLTGQAKFRALERASRSYRNEQDLLESTCEIVYGHAWAPLQINLGDSGVTVPLDQLRRRRIYER